MDRSEKSLEEVRKRIDSIDDRLHDLLKERAALVRAVDDAKATSGGPTYRPGREADILRRLADRHDGEFPLGPLMLIWRQIISASLGLQERFVVAVYAAEESDACQEVAEIHFGAAAPVSIRRTAAGVFNDVTRGNASAGILPFPAEGEDAPWWPRLVRYGRDPEGGNGPSIVARLPFVPTQRHSGPSHDSLVIAMQDPHPSARDRSVVVVTVGTETSRGRVLGALKAHGLEPKMTLTHSDDVNRDSTLFLVEVDGFVERKDERIAAVAEEIGGEEPAVVQVLGAYAEPFVRKDIDAQQAANEQ
ncbi:MAG: chorismate mutase [Defluviicoccus sp.]|nr:chorismate mutase [Defluviicoccus sp.]MDE0276641.1 chorismate mutase [Defluviicoccus sp.]